MRKVVIITDCYDIASAEIRAKIFAENNQNNYVIEPVVPVYPLSILNASFGVRLLIEQYPEGTIFLLLCSPSKELHERLIVKTKNQNYIVAGNHGTLSLLIEDELIEEVVNIPRKTISTFGGRDVYATYVSHLLKRNISDELVSLPGVEKFSLDKLIRIEGIKSKVLHIDNFGLIKINDRNNGRFIQGDIVEIIVNKESITNAVFSKRFMELDDGTLTVYEGSSLNGLLEIAVVRKNAADLLNIKIGDEIFFKKKDTSIKAIFFDLSGTLIKRDNLKGINLSEFLDKSGLNLPVKEFNRIFSEIVLKQKLDTVQSAVDKLEKKLKPKNSEYFREQQTRFLNSLTNNFDINVDLKEILEDLKDNYQLGILSNTDSITFSNIDKEFLDIFNYKLPSFITRFTKPEKEAYENILKATTLESHEILIIGDSDTKDLVVARELGMFTILFTDVQSLTKSLNLYRIYSTNSGLQLLGRN